MRRKLTIFENRFSTMVWLVSMCSVAIAIGCRKRGTSGVPVYGHDRGRATGHAHGSGNGHHPFTDPEGLAAKFNDPKRDEWQHPQEIVAALALEPGATVADIGAGTGYMVA